MGFLRSTIMVLIGVVVLATFLTSQAEAQHKIVGRYTFPEIAIKSFQNAIFPGSVPDDHKIFLGSVGSDLWHGPNDGPGEFWMLSDRGLNGQIKVDGKNRRTFWLPEFNLTIL